MLIDFPTEISFYAPEGNCRIRLKEIGLPSKPTRTLNCDSQVRFAWDVIFPENSKFDYVVAKNYCQDAQKGSILRTDLESWLGPNILQELRNGDGKIDLQKLVGREADAVVKQRFGKGDYKHPFSYIESLHPIGTLTEC